MLFLVAVGERDKNKRSKMGAIANKYADNRMYVTDDNPRNENPSKISEKKYYAKLSKRDGSS